MSAPTEHGRPAGRDTLALVSRSVARRVLVALHVAALACLAVELAVPFGGHGEDGGHGVERVAALDFLGSYALYGFVGCVVLVLIGRLLRTAVMRGERYYGEQE